MSLRAALNSRTDDGRSSGFFSKHFKIKSSNSCGISTIEVQQPVAHPAADETRAADPAHGVEQRPQVGWQLHGHSSFAHAANIRQIQPESRLIPPSGVTGPSQRGPPSASA